MYTTNNNFKVFVTNSTVGNAVTGVDLSSLVSGVIAVVVDNDAAVPNSGVAIATTGISTLKFAQKSSNGVLHFSPKMRIKDIIALSYDAYDGGLNQTSFVGYNGTSGNIQAIDYNDYILGLIYKHDDLMWSEQINRKPYLVSTDVNSTSYGVAKSFADLINGDSYTKVYADVTSDGTLADFTGTANAIKLVNGSTIASFVIQDATSGYVASTGTTVVGDVWNFPSYTNQSVTFTANILGTGAGRHLVTLGDTIYNVADAGDAAANAVAVAAAINSGTQAIATVSTAAVTIVVRGDSYLPIHVTYSADDSSWTTATLTVNQGDSVPVTFKTSVAASAAASFTLDRPWAGPSCYYTGGATTISKYCGILTTISNYGLKLTGITLDWSKNGIFPYKQVAFDLSLNGFGTTTQSTTAAKYPHGNAKQVRDIEWFSQFGSDGIRNAMSIPIPTGREDTQTSPYANYKCMTIKFKGNAESDPIVAASDLTATIFIFFPDSDAAYTTYYTYIMASLAALTGLSVQ